MSLLDSRRDGGLSWDLGTLGWNATGHGRNSSHTSINFKRGTGVAYFFHALLSMNGQMPFEKPVSQFSLLPHLTYLLHLMGHESFVLLQTMPKEKNPNAMALVYGT